MKNVHLYTDKTIQGNKRTDGVMAICTPLFSGLLLSSFCPCVLSAYSHFFFICFLSGIHFYFKLLYTNAEITWLALTAEFIESK